MCTGFTFSQPLRPATGLIGRGKRLHHDALVAAVERRGEESACLIGIRRHDPIRPVGRRNHVGQDAMSLGGWFVEQVDAVDMEGVEHK